jgi:DNA-binding transcriptional ArsR family regulator
MAELAHPGREDLMLSRVLYALSDPVRLRIAAMLADGAETSCGALNIPLPKSTLSHHFKVLRECGVTRTRVDGMRHLLSLRRDDHQARFPGVLDSIVAASAVAAGTGWVEDGL